MARREEEARLEMMMKEAEKAKNGEKRFTFKTKRWMHDRGACLLAQAQAQTKPSQHQNKMGKDGIDIQTLILLIRPKLPFYESSETSHHIY